MFSYNTVVLLISCTIALVAALRLTRKRTSSLPLPPGPRPLPFLGNALQLDTSRPWLTYTAWGKEYGNIIYTHILGIEMIIVNSDTIARELLNKRSAIYSDRPVVHTRELSGLTFVTALLQYGEPLQQHRKIFHQVLKADASLSYYKMYLDHAKELITDLLNARGDPRKPIEAYDRYMGCVSMRVTYGHIARRDGDPLLDRAHEFADIVLRIITPEKSALFTAFPFLGKLPSWCFSKDYALMERSKVLSQWLLEEPISEVKAQMAEGTAPQSLVSEFLSQPHDEAEEEMLKAVALSGFLAGAGTAASAIRIFILAMVLYPDVQERARAEIDRVVEHDRLPSIDHRSSLPYIDAVFREVLRWYPPAPLGVAHVASKDDVYDGYFIPKGTMVMSNLWAMSRNEDEFPNASSFDPTHHLTTDGQLTADRHTSNHFAFGYGRRICPGRFLAEDAIWVAMVTILSVLRMDHAKDMDGKRIEIVPEFTPGIQATLKPFPCTFESVNKAREELLL